MNTLTKDNCDKAADDVLSLMEELGFTSENQYDPDSIRSEIALIIRNHCRDYFNTQYSASE